LRLFIAIDIPDEIKRAISELIGRLKKTGSDVKWVRPETVHITLKFLGEVEESKIKAITDRLEMISKRHAPFELEAVGTGVFPDYSRPRVLWIGIRQNEEVQKIYEEINTELKALGFEEENRAFKPHLTIGRVKSRSGLNQTLKTLRGFSKRDFGKISVKEILLMKSTLKPTGAEYEKIHVSALRKEDL